MIFPVRYDFIDEVTKFEDSMPLYADALRKIGRYIRHRVMTKQNVEALARIMNVLNGVLYIEIEVLGQEPEFIHDYVNMIVKKRWLLPGADISKLQDVTTIAVCENIVKNQWNNLSVENAEDAKYERDFISIMDDILKSALSKYPDVFYVNIDDAFLARGRRGAFRNPEEIMPPPLDVAQKLNVINRWNPCNKRYNYLVISNTNLDIETSLLETRTYSGEYTIAQFKPVKPIHDVIDMDFDRVSFEDINNELNEYTEKTVESIVENLIDNNIDLKDSKREIQKYINAERGKTIDKITVFTAKLLLKYISDSIFIPLSDEEDMDKDLKEKCYKSFHILASYFEKQGIAGIKYPSTRQRKNGKYGSNLVLFDAECVFPDVKTMTVIRAEEYV